MERLSGELADCHKEIETLKAQGDEKAEQTKAKLIEWKGLAEQANSRYETLASETAVEKDRLKAALISADCKANVIDTKYQACLLAIEKLERDIGTNGKTSGEAQRKLVQMASKSRRRKSNVVLYFLNTHPSHFSPNRRIRARSGGVRR